MKKGLLVFGLLLSGAAAMGQGTGHAHALPPLIKGGENPEKVPDSAAWLAQLIASTSSEKDDANTKAHAAVHRQRMGLGGVNEATLEDFRTQFEWIIANETGMEARHDVGVLAANTVSKIKIRLPQPEFENVTASVMQEREKIAFQDESSSGSASLTPHFQLAQFQFNQEYDDQGYSQYVSVDGTPNSNTYYVTVYIYGNSNQPWMGTIGVAHSFYITNQLDGVGPNQQSVGSYLANQYVNVSQTIVGKWDQLKHKITSGGIIVCVYAGVFFRFVYDFLTTQGTSYFVWNGQGVWSTCGVNPTCTNPRPWIIDGTKVWVGYYGACNTSGPGWACHGMCIRNPFTLLWSCPLPDTFMEACTGMPTSPGPQFCTPHP